MVKIHILGAIDRLNYGDLLFPHVIEQELESIFGESFSYKYFGLVRSDYRKYGAKPSKSLRDFYKLSDSNDVNIIIAGGEALGASYDKLLSFINPIFWRLNNSYKVKKTFDMEKIAKILLGGKTKYPFTLSKNDFRKDPKVFYNSLGGSGLGGSYGKKSLDEIMPSVISSDYFSVRDGKTYKSFLDNGCLTIKLVPDSAILISDFFSPNYLQKIIREKFLKKFQGMGKDYIVFQVGKYKYGNDLNIIIEQIKKIFSEYKIPVALCSIGSAPGHEDFIPLSLINNRLPEYTLFYNDLTIWETMYLILNSSLYIGTSLHGIITAMSYGVPYLGINKNLTKLQSYLNTWGHANLKVNVNFNEIYKYTLLSISTNRNEIEEMTKKQKKMVHSSFINIGEKLHV